MDLHLKAGHGHADALDRQMARVVAEMESAIRAGNGEIIFIHGAGSGILREKIREIIRERYPSFIYYDAPFSRYGYQGATAVTLTNRK